MIPPKQPTGTPADDPLASENPTGESSLLEALIEEGERELQSPETPVQTPTDGSPAGPDDLMDALDGAMPVTPSAPAAESAADVPPAPKPPKKKANPMDFLRFVGVLFAVALIFFGSFLAYIVFNPENAQFFVGFGINPADIKSLLARLVSVIFGATAFLLSVVWLVFLFRAIRTRKEYRRKKTISVILAVFTGILLFSSISLWAYLTQIIDASDYENPDGGVVISDNDRLLSGKYADSAKMYDFGNLVGPVTLRFDLSSNVRMMSRKMRIESYSIDYDGNGVADKTGTDPERDQSIIHTYDAAGQYSPVLTYRGSDILTRESIEQRVNLPNIDIVGVVRMDLIPERMGGTKVRFDAESLRPYGNVTWYIDDDSSSGAASNDYKFAPSKVFREDGYVCLMLSQSAGEPVHCDHVFVVRSEERTNPIEGEIFERQDDLDPLLYTFDLGEDDGKLKVANGGIEKYEWIVDGSTVISDDPTTEHKFTVYGRHSIAVNLTDFVGNTRKLEKDFVVRERLQLELSRDEQSMLVRYDDTTRTGAQSPPVSYDSRSRTYTIKNVPVPSKFTFDARDVRATDPLYTLEKAEWDLDGDGTYETITPDVVYSVDTPARHTISARYTFASPKKNDSQIVTETVIIDAERQEVTPSFTITASSDYVPAIVTVDASASSVARGRIAKFIVDFGRPGFKPQEGDAVQNSSFELPGTYDVSVTVVRDDGETATATKKLVLKDAENRVVINTSVSSGLVGREVDFDSVGTVGQIETYFWKFGDGIVSSDPTPTHVYKSAGEYAVELRIKFVDGSVRTQKLDFKVSQ